MATAGIDTQGYFEMTDAGGTRVCCTDTAIRPIERVHMLLREIGRISLGISHPRPDYSQLCVTNSKGETLKFVGKYT